jgi:hypothetical protein
MTVTYDPIARPSDSLIFGALFERNIWTMAAALFLGLLGINMSLLLTRVILFALDRSTDRQPSTV